jgi:hypothetical protein
MRRFSLQAIRARVAISVGAAGCGESHVRLHFSDVWNDDPEPATGLRWTPRHIASVGPSRHIGTS